MAISYVGVKDGIDNVVRYTSCELRSHGIYTRDDEDDGENWGTIEEIHSTERCPSAERRRENKYEGVCSSPVDVEILAYSSSITV